MRDILEPIKIFSPTAVLQAAFTAAATNIITSVAHGLSNGDCIQVTTSAGDLPAGLAITTNYYVIDKTTDTFKVSTVPGGSAVDITDAGTGTHTFHLKGKAIYVADYRHINLHLTFSGSPTMTIKTQGSRQLIDSPPDFNASQSITNKWDYIELIDLEDGSAIDGDTGVACAGSADNRHFAVNTDGLSWITIAVTAWTAGLLGVELTAYND